MAKKKMHYAWKIVIACIFLKIGTAGATAACMSNFIAPIVKDLNCMVSELTMFISLNAVSMALLYTLAARILTTKRIGVVMGVASLVEVIGIALMATYRTVHMFYLSGIMIGAAQAFTGLVAIPILINMWFKKKTGFVLGLVIAIGNAATVGYGLLSAQLITSFGWRNAYLILAAMALVLTVPEIFILVRTPKEVGCEPYGAEETSAEDSTPREGEWGLTKRQAFRMPFVYVTWIACILISYGCAVAGYVNAFSTMELGQTINFGARAGMFLSFGGILSSILVGRINDRFGVKAGLAWGVLSVTAGYLLMFLGYRNPLFIYLAAFVVGLGNSMYMVQCPLLARSVVGSKNYSEIWATMMVANSLIGGGLYSSVGLFYDKTGTYSGAFIMSIALHACALLFGALAINMSRKYRKKHLT